MEVRLHVTLEEFILAEVLPIASVKCGVRQLVCLHVPAAWDFPEARLDTEIAEPVAKGVELLDEVLIDQWKVLGVHVPVIAPLLDPGGHAVHHVSRVGLDDDFLDVAFVLEATVGEHVSDFT